MLNDGVTQVDYFNYHNTSGSPSITESAPSGAPMNGSSSAATLKSTTRPSYLYSFSDVAKSSNINGTYEYGTSQISRGVCGLGSNQNTTFADYTTSPTDSGFPSTYPAEFNESRLESGLKGISVLAQFNGNLLSGQTAQGNAYETFYYHDQQCTYGGHEYGFAADMNMFTSSTPGGIYFYYSDHTNCVGSCGANDGDNFPRGVNYEISGLSDPYSDHKYYFQAYYVADSSLTWGYIIRVQVLDENASLVTCTSPTAPSSYSPISGTYSITGNAGSSTGTSNGACTFDITPGTWFRSDIAGSGGSNSNGYLFSGIVLSGNPDGVGNSPGLDVYSFGVGK